MDPEIVYSSEEDDDVVVIENEAATEQVAEHSKENCRENESETLECSICLQIFVHPSKLPCGHIFCFLCVKGLENFRCAICRTPFPIEYLDRPELLTPIGTTASTSDTDSNGYQWFYKGSQSWWQYDKRTCQEIEDAYQSGEKQCSISVAGHVYVVDFGQMQQLRQNNPSLKRQVKRDLATIPTKGVAGLRYRQR